MTGFVVLLVLLWVVLAAMVASIAEGKGYSGFVFLVLGFVATPLVSFIVVDRLKDKSPQKGVAATGRVDDLEKLVELHERGALTDEEFAQEKSRMLGAEMEHLERRKPANARRR